MPPALRTITSLVAALALAAALPVAGVLGAPAASASPARDGRTAFRAYETPNPPAGPGEPVVALTFDDGPHPSYTPQILEILARYGVKATFFQVGAEVERHPEVVEQLVAEGHVVANHTWTHPSLPTLDEARFQHEIDRTTKVIERASGQRVLCARPPYGHTDGRTVERLRERGLASVLWTGDSRDFTKPGVDEIVRSSLSGLQPGAVILLHDGGGRREQTIAALPRIIEGIVAAGYRIEPICGHDRHLPLGGLDTVKGGPGGRIDAVGWAADPDSDDPVEVHLHLDGSHAATTTATTRPVRGDRGPGYRGTMRTTPGPHEVCAYAINLGLGRSPHALIGCAWAEVPPLTAFDDLRPLAARVRYAQLRQQAEVVRRVVLVHDARRLPWRIDRGPELARR